MLLTKTITIKVNSSNLKNLLKYYHDIKTNDLKEIPVEYLTPSSHHKVEVLCDICGKTKYIEYRLYVLSTSHYNYYTCSPKCSVEKVELTNIVKYGFGNVFQNENIKNKSKNTIKEKYGVENVSYVPEIVEKIKINVNKTYSENLKEIKEKIKKTNIIKYGVEDPNQEEWLKEKIKNIIQEKYHVNNIMELPEIKEKIKKITKERYGDENYRNIEQTKKTNLERYGFKTPLQNEDVKNKIKQTRKERYGFEFISQNEEIFNNILKSGLKIKQHECGLYYQGTYEKDFIDFCIINKIEILKSPTFLYKYQDINRKYYPDFIIPHLKLIIEIKSTYWLNKHKELNITKKEAVLANNYNYLLILNKNYDEFKKMLNILK
jgi:hypothetical protein